MTQYPQWYVWVNGIHKPLRTQVTDGTLNRMALFENGNLIDREAGSNFDGQGLSLGTLQFAGMVQGSLQDLINEFFRQYPDAARRELNAEGSPLYEEVLAVLPDKLPYLFNRINKYPAIIPDGVHPQSEQFKKLLYDARRGDAKIIEPWKSGLERMAMCPEWQQAELPFIQGYIDSAANLIMYYENNSEGDKIATDRGFDICFDIMCQSGGTKMYPLGEKAYLEKLYAVIYAYTLHMGDSEWARRAVARKMGLLNGYYDMYDWTASYDDETIWQEEYDMAHATGNIDDAGQPSGGSTSPGTSTPPPVSEPMADEEMAGLMYLQTIGVLDQNAVLAYLKDRPMTFGQYANLTARMSEHLWETHLKYIKKG